MAPLFLKLLLVMICAQAHECHKHYQSSLQENNEEKEIMPAHASVNREYNSNKIMPAPVSVNRDYNNPTRLVRVRRSFLYNEWDGILNNKSRDNQPFFFTNEEMRRLKDFWMKDKEERGWANQEWMDEYYQYWENVTIPEDSTERKRKETEGKKRKDNGTTSKRDKSFKKTMQDEGKTRTKHKTVPNERTRKVAANMLKLLISRINKVKTGEIGRLKDFWMRDKDEKGVMNQKWMDDYYKRWDSVTLPENYMEIMRKEEEGKRRKDSATTLKRDKSFKENTMQDERRKHKTIPNERTKKIAADMITFLISRISKVKTGEIKNTINSRREEQERKERTRTIGPTRIDPARLAEWTKLWIESKEEEDSEEE